MDILLKSKGMCFFFTQAKCDIFVWILSIKMEQLQTHIEVICCHRHKETYET